MEKNKELRVFAEEIRVLTLEAIASLGFGHIGGSMSVVELLSVLYGKFMNIDPKNPSMKERDWLVMSKGHAGPAVYASLALKGYFPKEDVLTLNKPGTHFPSHTDRNTTIGVDMTTGSLGQGVSTAIGIAIGNRISGINNHTFLVVGDGECNEGQVWEGLMFAAHNKLDTLICFVDNNKKQLDGTNDEIMSLGDISAKFTSFGWHTQSIDGHNIDAIISAINEAYSAKGKPHCIILNTIKANGCKLAQNAVANHSSKFTAAEMDDSLAAAREVLAKARG